MRRLTHLSLFSGIGGIDIAAEWAGFRTVCFVEIDKYCQRVLRKHWPDVPLVEDIRDVTEEKVRRIISKITLITGGFPCQPVSVAGERRGKADDRWLWPEMLRVLHELKPSWVLGENVAGITGMDKSCQTAGMEGEVLEENDTYPAILDGICADLEGIGYEVQPFLIPACAVGALHRRDRVFIVAHSSEQGLQGQSINIGGEREKSTNQQPLRCHRVSAGGSGATIACLGRSFDGFPPGLDYARRWADGSYEEGIPRVARGIKNRVNRLKCLGNAVVPQQVYPLLRGIADIESGRL